MQHPARRRGRPSNILVDAVLGAGTTAPTRWWCCWSPPGRRSRPRARASAAAIALITLPDATGWRRPSGRRRTTAGQPRARRAACAPCSRSQERVRLRVRRRPGVELRRPRPLRRLQPRSRSVRVWARTSAGTSKVLLGVEAEDLLGRGDLLVAERGAVALPVPWALGAGQRDDRVEHDQRRPVGDRRGRSRSRRAARGRPRRTRAVVGPVDDLHVPAVGLVALRARPR